MLRPILISGLEGNGDGRSRRQRFLTDIKMAEMATINSDGSPHLSPNWYYYDGEQLFSVTTKERKKFTT